MVVANQQQGGNSLLSESKELAERLQPGAELGRYVVRQMIGIGSMGVVCRAEDLANGEEAALKALLPARGRRLPETLSRFHVQAALLSGLHHESVVEIQDIGWQDDICFLVMPLVAGPEEEPVSLGEYADWFGGVVTPGELLEIFGILLSAFAHFHDHKIVHGNMKPHNVLLNCVSRDSNLWQAKVMVTDFGLSRILGTDFIVESVRKSVRTYDVRATSGQHQPLPPDAKALLQTYDYMSPEQRKGKGASRRSDIFSLGMMFLHLLTGKKVIGFEPPSQICPGIDSAWDDFILKATNQERTQRFLNIHEMQDAFEQLSVKG